MSKNIGTLSNEQNLTFPLTLSEALQCLTKDMKNTDQTATYTKTWEQLAVRLKDVFDVEYKNRHREILEMNFGTDEFNKATNHLEQQLSDTKRLSLGEKYYYIFSAATIYYIQHPESPLSPGEVHEQLLYNKIDNKLNLKSFTINALYIIGLLPGMEKANKSNKFEKIILNYSMDTMINFIKSTETLLNSAYDYIIKNYASSQKITKILSDIPEFSGNECFKEFSYSINNSIIPKKLSKKFVEYKNFYTAISAIVNICNEIWNYIDKKSNEFDWVTNKILPSRFDKISNTETEVSQLEYDFFLYLLKNIPSRKKDEKSNITNQLSYNKWEILPIDVRTQITKYLSKMKKQPKRLIRFLGEKEFEEHHKKSLNYQIDWICFKILHPKQYRAYWDCQNSLYMLDKYSKLLLMYDVDDWADNVVEINTTLSGIIENNIKKGPKVPDFFLY